VRLWLAAVLLTGVACFRSVGDEAEKTPAGRAVPPAVVPKVPVEPTTAPDLRGHTVDGAAGALPSAGPLVTLSIDGVRKQLRQAVGRVLLVHVWASWCAPCLFELPEFDHLVEKARARGVQVLVLAVDSDSSDIARVPNVLRERAPHLAPVVADYRGQNEFFALLSKHWSGSIPATFVFDRRGKLHAEFLNVGEFRQIDAALDQLLTNPETGGGRAGSHGGNR